MEPRPHERGNLPPHARERAHVRLQWSHVLTNVETTCSGYSRCQPSWLQWSHVLTNVETRSPNAATARATASMEPRPHERGNEARSEAAAPGLLASMEPRPHERGNELTPDGTRPQIPQLQWSHVLTNVETSRRCCRRRRESQLQWSHVLTNVETTKIIMDVWGALELQWSHVLTNVETIKASRAKASGVVGFNGATSSRTWKRQGRRDWKCRHALASMEPRPHERGNKATSTRCSSPATELQWSHVLTNVETFENRPKHLVADASMEPRPHERGNFRPRGEAFFDFGCFNGATSSRTWKPLRFLVVA